MSLRNRRDGNYIGTRSAFTISPLSSAAVRSSLGPPHTLIRRPQFDSQPPQTPIKAPPSSDHIPSHPIPSRAPLFTSNSARALFLALFGARPRPSSIPSFSLRSAMGPGSFLLITLALACSASLMRGAAAAAQQQHCVGDFDKVTSCLDFVQGKEAAAPKQCCAAVGEIRDSDPACLCFFIEQIHNGSNPMIKSMNIQESRLLQLPSACNLKNSSISDCPKLLGIPTSSPDYAIFANTSSSTAAPVTAGTGTPSSAQTAGDSSGGTVHRCMSALAIIVGTILLASFPRWFEL
ncbi:AAI domain-containing protein [Psidium guajava]|nr:AAI domain-containing protein [Psidium guajava]